MVDKQTIISLYRIDGHSKRGIAPTLNLDRKTVHRVLLEYDKALESDNATQNIEQLFLTILTYSCTNRRAVVLTDEIKKKIDDYLSDNHRKINLGLHKQRMLKSDIYEELINKNINISYSTVCNYIRLKEKKRKG